MRSLLLCFCLLSALVSGNAQKPPPQAPPPPRSTPAEPPAQGIPNPKATVKNIPPEQLYETSDGHTSVKLFYWSTHTHPAMFTGKGADFNVDSTTNFPTKTKPAPGVEHGARDRHSDDE